MHMVPLVSYESGKRLVIGTAVIKDDGSIQATIDPSDRGEHLIRMLSRFGELSINQKFENPNDIVMR